MHSVVITETKKKQTIGVIFLQCDIIGRNMCFLTKANKDFIKKEISLEDYLKFI